MFGEKRNDLTKKKVTKQYSKHLEQTITNWCYFVGKFIVLASSDFDNPTANYYINAHSGTKSHNLCNLGSGKDNCRMSYLVQSFQSICISNEWRGRGKGWSNLEQLLGI